MSSLSPFSQTLILNLVQRGLFLSDEEAASTWRALLMEIDRQAKSGSADMYEALRVAIETTIDPYGIGMRIKTHDLAKQIWRMRDMPVQKIALELGVSEPTIRHWLSGRWPRRRQPRPRSTKGGAK
ncbi:MAG: hypothetical protein LBK99_15560 [Opitutaceae bacterium]|jgi:hypothetical protein|nr:hypothetical protein [Opitutaceae bacterium]